MKDKHIFVDTNILIYAHDSQAGVKYDRARELVDAAWHRPYPPAISIQVLQEFYVNLVRKNVDISRAQDATKNYLRWEVISGDSLLLDKGFEVQKRWKLSFWDSLIVAAALKAKAAILWSEDFTAGQRFDSVQVINPLA